MSKISKADVLRYGQGDPDFSEARNRAIIKRTIEKTNANYKKKQKMIDEGLAERADVLASYMRHQLNKKEMSIEEYAGWEQMRRFVGEERLLRLQQLARSRQKLLI